MHFAAVSGAPPADCTGRARRRSRVRKRGWNQATDAAIPPVHRPDPGMAHRAPGAPNQVAGRSAADVSPQRHSPRGDRFWSPCVQPMRKLWRSPRGQRDSLRGLRAATEQTQLVVIGGRWLVVVVGVMNHPPHSHHLSPITYNQGPAHHARPIRPPRSSHSRLLDVRE